MPHADHIHRLFNLASSLTTTCCPFLWFLPCLESLYSPSVSVLYLLQEVATEKQKKNSAPKPLVRLFLGILREIWGAHFFFSRFRHWIFLVYFLGSVFLFLFFQEKKDCFWIFKFFSWLTYLDFLLFVFLVLVFFWCCRHGESEAAKVGLLQTGGAEEKIAG